jgi:hypothetical protein
LRSRAKRHRRRLTCELRFADGRRAPGIVADLSRTGLFVQTSATALPDTLLELRMMPSSGEQILLRVRVARQKRVDQRLVTISAAGLGLEILEAPESYYRGLPADEREFAPDAAPSRKASGGPASASASPAAPDAPAAADTPGPARPALRAWKVRLSQVSGPRSRVVRVEAASEQDARARALAELGDGWQALDVNAA